MRAIRSRSPLVARLAEMSPLIGFTVVAVFGYLYFVVAPWGPTNLAELASRPGFSWIPGFYATSFNFFAQAHILVGAVVLFVFLLRKSGIGWLPAFVLVYALSLASELLGTSTGLPFGPYQYTALLGAKWFDLVPLLIPVSWFLMAVPAYLIATHRFGQSWRKIFLGAALLTAWDLALDPAMSFITVYWAWGEPGSYYGMPLINLVGWFATSLVLMVALDKTRLRDLVSDSTTGWMWLYYLVTVALPVGMILAAGHWPAALLTAIVVAVLYRLSVSNRTAGDNSPRGDHSFRDHSFRDNSHQGNSLQSKSLFGTSLLGTSIPARSLFDTVPPSQAQAHALAQIPVNLHDYFDHHSKSFSFAARFFASDERQKVSRLYAFCRITDDLVDEHVDSGATGPAARSVLDAWKQLVRSSFEGSPSGVSWLDTLMAETHESGAGFETVQLLFDGVESDLATVRIQTQEELDAYAYKVGSVVGIWLCNLLDVRSERMHYYAAMLGSAMQLTNILRDVGEDLRSDRIYLPLTLLEKHGITESELRRMQSSRTVSNSYASLIRELIVLAESRYEKAWEGLTRLPNSFGNAAAVASEVYRGIHREIVFNGFDNLNHRARTSRTRKCYLAFNAWILVQGHRREVHREQEEMVLQNGDGYGSNAEGSIVAGAEKFVLNVVPAKSASTNGISLTRAKRAPLATGDEQQSRQRTDSSNSEAFADEYNA